jgi:cytochrome c biogenesis protein CcdA
VNYVYTYFKYGINISKYVPAKGSITLGVVFGLVIPAYAISFVLELVGRSILLGKFLEGFISLFVFGITLSSPLMVIGSFDRSSEIMARISNKAGQIPWLEGLVLIIVGLLTMLSSRWWAGAAG